VELVAIGYRVAKFDLALDLYEEGDNIVGGLNYATALFDEATIQRHCGYFISMLKAMVVDSEQAVARINLLAPEEHRLLESWNATETPYPQQFCIHQLFEQQAHATPQATAVVCQQQSLSYAELNRQANRLAHYLIALGVQPEERVAICVERSLEMVIGLLAILKAGGAYVPIDPAYPSARLRQVLTAAAPKIVLSDGVGREALGQEALRELMVLDLEQLKSLASPAAQPPEWADRPACDPNPVALGLTSHHLAYVIYTSGSTGIPKGVQNEHHALINRLLWMQQAYGLKPSDVVLQKTSFSFDVSVWEFFWTLLQGATLGVAPPQAHKDPRQLIELIRQWQVTTIHFVPSMLGPFVNTEGVEDCVSLRRVICSGEALPGLHIQALQQ
jgi:non-ribosomal peptide synthetase component F